MISRICFGVVLAALTLQQQNPNLTFKPLYGETSVAPVWIPKTDLNITEGDAVIATERSDGSVVINGNPKAAIRMLVGDYAQLLIDDCRDTKRRDEVEYALVSAIASSPRTRKEFAERAKDDEERRCDEGWHLIPSPTPKEKP